MRHDSPRHVILTIVTLAAMTALAVWSAWPIYSTSRLAWVGLVGVVLGAGAALTAQIRGWSRWAGAGVAALGFVVAVVPVAVPSALGSPSSIARGLVDALAAVVVDWKRLLTISIPVSDYQTLMVPFLALVVVCAWAAMSLSFLRGRASSLAVIPMVAMSAFGALFGSADAGRSAQWGPVAVPAVTQTLLGAGALAVCGAWLIGRARLDRSEALRVARSQTATVRAGGAPLALTVRRRVMGVLLVIAAAGVGLALAPATDALDARVALRDEVLPPEVISSQVSPLTTYRGWFVDGTYDATLLTVSGDVEGQRLRLATLDAYDGQTFHIGASGSEFARQPNTQSADISVTIGSAYDGVWVPVTTAEGGAPDFSGARADELADSYYADLTLDTAVVALDDAAAGEGLQEGDSYTIAASAAADSSTLEGTTGGDSTVSEDDYPALAAWVEQQELGRTGADLVELISRLQERGYLSHAANEDGAEDWIADLTSRAPYAFEPVRAGHTSARVETVFQNLLDQELRAGDDADEELLVSAVGDDEQFAAAAAVLANYLGFDSRVVVGVRLGTSDSADGVQACASECTGANVTAWVEVRAGTSAWVPIDVTPQFESTPTRIRQGESLPENPTDVEEPSSEVIDPPSAQHDESSDEPTPNEEETSDNDAVLYALTIIATMLVGSVLLLAPFLVLPIAKVMRRRWRRDAAVPEVAMVGAWEDLVDTYVDSGREVPDRLTRGELADLLERDAAVTLAAVVDRAVFAEHPPTREASDAVWQIVDDERRAVASSLPWSARFKAVLSPASLLRRARAGTRGAPSLSHHPGRKTHAEL